MIVDEYPEELPNEAQFEAEQSAIEALTAEVEAFWERQDRLRAEEISQGKAGRVFINMERPWNNGKADFDALPVDY